MSGSIIHAEGHGLSADAAIYFASLTPDSTGIDESVAYYVLAEGLTADSFEFSRAIGGTPFVLNEPITDGRLLSAESYQPLGGDDAMSPPVPPVPPTALVVEGTQVVDATGVTVQGLIVRLQQPDDPTVRTTFVKITTATKGDGTPDWTKATIYPISPGETSLSIAGVIAGTPYWVTSYSTSVYGLESGLSEVVNIPPVYDVSAPPEPVGIVVAPALRGFVAAWDNDPSIRPAGDFAFYEVRYCLGDVAAPSGAWTYIRSKTGQIYVGGLDPLPGEDGVPTAKYWVQVRSVDTTGNVLVDGVVKHFLGAPEGGWSDPVSVFPTMVDGTMVQLASLNTTHLSALDAGIINTGHLRISTTRSDLMDGIAVYDGTTQVGVWDETGLYVYDVNNTGNYVKMYAGGITVYYNGVASTAISPAGVNATSITSGALPGGGNLVSNSSFELSDFQTPASLTWTDDLTANFNATVSGSNTNVSVSDDLHMTGASF